jgi:hypothetical protein
MFAATPVQAGHLSAYVIDDARVIHARELCVGHDKTIAAAKCVEAGVDAHRSHANEGEA